MQLRLLFCFLSFSFIALTGCSGDDNKKHDGCSEGFAYKASTAPRVLTEIVSKYIPSGKASCYDEATITDESTTASVFVIEYGADNDCPSGCFSSILCVIDNENDTEIYSAKWTTEDEIPFNLGDTCESTIGGSGNSIFHCQEPPSGFSHPITSALQFSDLLNNEDSMFRLCR